MIVYYPLNFSVVTDALITLKGSVNIKLGVGGNA